MELAREQAVRQAIYPLLTGATKDEKIQLGIVLARSGETGQRAVSRNPVDGSGYRVAQEGIRDLRTLRARLQ